MTIELTCPACGSEETVAQSYSETVDFKGILVSAHSLQRMACQVCGYIFGTDDQHDRNVDVVRAAFVYQRAAAKQELGRLTGQEIRAIRNGLGLSQQEAAELFGGGVNAFSRYENEEVVQPVSMDRLIRLAAYLGVKGLPAIRASRSVSSVQDHSTRFMVCRPVGNMKILNIAFQTVGVATRQEVSASPVTMLGTGAQVAKAFKANPLTGAMYSVET